MLQLSAVLLLFAAVAAGPAGAANPYADQLMKLVEDRLRPIAADPVVVASVKARADRALPQAEIDRLDAEWRASVGTPGAPLFAEIAGDPASARLVAAQAASEGLLTEIFAMDHQGLNVAMSETTSDYWQGDEAKWQETYLVGPDAVHMGEVDWDESAQTYAVQVSLTVVDPESGAPIGAVTFGVNAELLN